MSAETSSQPPKTRTTASGIISVARASISVALLVALYYILPHDGFDDPPTIMYLAISILILLLVMAWQVSSIVRSSRPALRAVETALVSLAFFILLMATTYVLMSEANDQAFSEALTRTDALYFSMTVFSTVGFGDISPLTQAARLVVTTQIFLDLMFLGIGLKIVAGAVNVARQRQAREGSDEQTST